MSARVRRDMFLRMAASQNWRCFWCGIKMCSTLKPNGQPHWNTATRDHLHPSGERDTVQRGHRYKYVASCYKCNHERGNQDFFSFYLKVRPEGHGTRDARGLAETASVGLDRFNRRYK